MSACVHWSDHIICLIVENAFANNRKIKSICAEAPNYLMCVKMWTMRWMKGWFDVFETIDLLKCQFGWLGTDAYGNGAMAMEIVADAKSKLIKKRERREINVGNGLMQQRHKEDELRYFHSFV